MRNRFIQLIFKISKEEDAFDILEKEVLKLTKKEISQSIIDCGILPEIFTHDSSEEKLWAKFTDILLAASLTFLNIPSEVLRTRGDSADVFGKAKNYSIVADAKTFRLSRTAKNQKDFKVKALDDWRKGNNYALLVSPLIQYPSRRSQIYFQAIDKNVTLLSYTHLNLMLTYNDNKDFKPLWEVGKNLKAKLNSTEQQQAEIYWENIDKSVCKILNINEDALSNIKTLEMQKTKEIGQEGIDFWQNKIKEYKKLSKEEAINRLIASEKIETKIKTIMKAISFDN
ncbi:MAG: HindIII family type II restriction endonuclease [Ignavibacteria bacterium]|nr:HindIII family type II restriction endonuclease [Ignavibacteria bacterium]